MESSRAAIVVSIATVRSIYMRMNSRRNLLKYGANYATTYQNVPIINPPTGDVTLLLSMWKG